MCISHGVHQSKRFMALNRRSEMRQSIFMMWLLIILIGCSNNPTDVDTLDLRKNSVIVYQNYRTGQPKIILMNTEGEELRDLSPKEWDFDPNLSPDGDQIAFVGYRDGRLQIFLMSPWGAILDQLTNSRFVKENPTWSPDGNYLLFDQYESGHGEIYRMDKDGSHLVRLTDNPGVDANPSWSPDGKRIAFTRFQHSRLQIYLMDIRGSELKNVSNSDQHEYDPAWSPDGSQIAFVINNRIHLMHADGSNKVRLTTGEFWEADPIWSPDGTEVAFASKREDDNVDIYRIKKNGSGLIKLTFHPGEDRRPHWGILR